MLMNLCKSCLGARAQILLKSSSSINAKDRGFSYSWNEEDLGEFDICDMRRGDPEHVKIG